MLNFFRITGLFEGFSYLAILSVSLGFVSRDYVSSLGMVHGLLFMLYLFLSLQVSTQKRLSLKVWLPLFAASLIPFAFIPVEFYLKKLASHKTQVEGGALVESA